MAAIMKTVLGGISLFSLLSLLVRLCSLRRTHCLADMLPPAFVGKWDMSNLPSPAQLRNKVLLKVHTCRHTRMRESCTSRTCVNAVV
jgi:hypothetical protein